MTSKQPTFQVKRIYDGPAPQDGVRVLVDRLWPRGVNKERAAIDRWAKDVTPSDELRRWFHAEPEEHGDEFAARYRAELDGPEQRAALQELRDLAAQGPVTLVSAVKDVAGGHVAVLVDTLTH